MVTDCLKTSLHGDLARSMIGSLPRQLSMNVATILVEFLSSHRYALAAAVVLGLFIALRYLRASRTKDGQSPHSKISAPPPADTGVFSSPRRPEAQAAPPPPADTGVFGSLRRPEAQEETRSADAKDLGAPWIDEVQAAPPGGSPTPVAAADAGSQPVPPANPPRSPPAGRSIEGYDRPDEVEAAWSRRPRV